MMPIMVADYKFILRNLRPPSGFPVIPVEEFLLGITPEMVIPS